MSHLCETRKSYDVNGIGNTTSCADFPSANFERVFFVHPAEAHLK
jgi:hypothetical protein